MSVFANRLIGFGRKTNSNLASGGSFVISSSQNNINLFTLAGSPTGVGVYNFTINSGVVIGSTSTGTAALISGTFPVGSTLNLINNGSIYGKEGAGGVRIAGAGGAGGPAISLSYNISITNASGSIFGGGGGGGCGGDGNSGSKTPGGAGGAGQGYGNQAGPSVGGGGSPPDGGAGGTGGSWGTAGSSGENALPNGCCVPKQGGAGGAAGNSITKNGKTVTWVSGNDSTHVKGAQV